MSIAAHDSPSIQPIPASIPPFGLGGTLLPNLDSPSKSGRNDVGDHSEEELALDGFKLSLLPPNKRRKTTQSSSAIFEEPSLSSASQASPPFIRPHTLESASFTGGDVPRSDSPLDGASSSKHELDLTFNTQLSKLPHISPSTSHGATPRSVMPNSRHGAYTPKALGDTRQEKRIHSQSLLREFDSSRMSRQHEAHSSESASTSMSPSLESSVSQPETNARPVGGRSTRPSTQLMTQRSIEWAKRSQLGIEGVKTYGMHSTFLKPIEELVASTYRASADELELWMDAKVSPVVFGKRKFAGRLSEEEFKGAVTFNLRHLLPEMGGLNDTQHPEKRRSLTAMSETSRKSHIALIIQDALGSEGQLSVEEADVGFSTDVPNNLQGGLDTPADATDTDDHNPKVSIQPDHELYRKPIIHNTHSLLFQKQRRSFLPLNRNTPSFSTVNIPKDIVREHIPSKSLPVPPSISTHNNIQSNRSSTPHSHDSIHSFTSPHRSRRHEHSGSSPKELSREPLQTPKEPLPAAREPSVGVMELIIPMVTVEHPNIARSPSARSSSPFREDTTFTNSRLPLEGSPHHPLPRDTSTPSSLFRTVDALETTVDYPPPSGVFPQVIHDALAPSALASEPGSERYSEGPPASSHGKFFHECSMQTLDDTSDTHAIARGIIFRRITSSSNLGFRDVTTWPSPAAPDDHPYLQEARMLMVVAKLREDILPSFVEDEGVDTKEDWDSGIDGESEVDELDESEGPDPIESNSTQDELDTLSAFPSTPAATGQHNTSLPGWDSYSATPSRRARGLDHGIEGWENISASGARGTNTRQQSLLVPPAASSSNGDDRDSDHAGDGDDQINHEDQLEDWTTSLQTLVKGKRVLLPEELLNLKTILNAVHTHSPAISASSELAQTVLQVAKLEAKDIPNQDSLGLRSLARKSLRAWGLTTRTKT